MTHGVTSPRVALVRAPRTALAALAVLSLAACGDPAPAPTPEAVAWELRDVFPYPVVAGGGAEAPELAPLLDPYLVYIGREDFDGAAAGFAAAAEQNPELLEARLLQGISLVLADRDREAVPVLRQVVSERPAYAPARWFLAQALLVLGRREEAFIELREVAVLGGPYADEARSVLAAGG